MERRPLREHGGDHGMQGQPLEAPTPRRGGRPGREHHRFNHNYRMSPGDVLGRSFSVFFRQFPILLVLGVATYALPTWLQVLQVEGIFRAAQTGNVFAVRAASDDYQWPILITQLVLPFVFQAIVIVAVFEHLRGRPSAFAAAIPRGFAKVLPAIWTALLMGLGLGLVPVFASLMFAMLLGLPGLYVGLVATVLWVAILGCAWYVSVPVTVVERTSGGGAIGRSTLLTRGSRWSVFAVALVGFGIPAAVSFLLARMDVDPTLSALRTRVLVSGGIGALFGGLQAVTSAVMYHNLRVGKEGVDIEDLLKVFD